MKLRTLVIKGSEWLRGEGGAKSFLHRHHDGKMCCLGILGVKLSEGKAIEKVNIKSPSQTITPKLHRCYGEMTTLGTRNPMRINDDVITTDEEKIEELRPIFKRAGWLIRWLPDA